MTTMPTLQRMNASVYLYRPTDETVVEQSSSSSLVMMFTWMNARLQHEQKFIEALHRRYPTATILLIKSTMGHLLSTDKHMGAILDPVVDVLSSYKWDMILLYLFSNGGGFMFTALHQTLAKKDKLRPRIASRGPRVVCVLDSMPGDHAFESLLSLAAPRNQILYTLSVPLFAAAYGLWALMNMLSGKPPLFDEYRRTLLARSILPTITEASNPQPPRLYIYSTSDRVVQFEYVESHIQQAREMGFRVDVERYEKSPHVGHMRSDERRYWDAVERLWPQAKL